MIFFASCEAIPLQNTHTLLRIFMRRGVGGGDEGTHFRDVFFAGRELDSGDDIDTAGIEEADGITDVIRVKATGDDDRDMLLDALDDGEGGVPIEGLAGASADGRR